MEWSFREQRENARAWWQARKERINEQRALKRIKQSASGHDSRFFVLTVPIIATILAAITEWYWALLFCIEATGHIDYNWETAFGSETPFKNIWNFAFSAHLPVLIGLLAATAPIVMISMVWLPAQFTIRGAGRVRRGSLIAVGILANVLVIISGTVVMNGNRQDHVRETLVVEQSAAQGRAAIQARIDGITADLNTAMTNPNRILAQAASVGVLGGASEWERSYVAQARATNDPRLPLLERALGAARAAEAAVAQRNQLRQQLAAAAPEAATAAHVQDDVGASMNVLAQHLEVWRPPFVALICTLVGIFGAFWIVALLERVNPLSVLSSGWADERHRIEDLRGREVTDSAGRRKHVEPMEPPHEVATDADTGEELIKIKPREYWRRKVPKKGEPTKVNVEPDIPPDEAGVDAYATGRVLADGKGVMLGDAPPNNDSVDEPASAAGDQSANDEPVTLTEDEMALLAETAFSEEPEPEISPPDVDVADGSPPREIPEQREDRLIAAE